MPTKFKTLRPQVHQLEEREVPASLIGGLDVSFATSGKANFTLAAGTNQANAVAVQMDGKIILAGTTDSITPANSDFFLTRHNPDGSLDTTFGTNGKVVFGIAGKDDTVTGVGLLSDRSIIATGYTNRGGLYDFCVFKLNPNGGLDPSFASGAGVKTFNMFNNDKAYGMAMSSAGIVIVGASDIDGAAVIDKDDIAILRITTDGLLDPMFNGGSALQINLGKQEQGRSVAIDSDGTMVVAGYVQDPSTANTSDFVVLRVQSNGTGVVPTFGSTVMNAVNVAKIDFSANDDKAYSVAIDFSGNVVAAGSAFIPGDTDFAMVRLSKADGTLDTSFSSTGKLTADLGGDDEARTVMIDGRGRYILTGSAFKGSSFDFTAVSVEPDGSAFTPSFGTSGVSYTNIVTEDKAYAATMDMRGRIILAGRALGNIAVTRLIGTLDERTTLLAGGSTDGRVVSYNLDTITSYGTPGTPQLMFSNFDRVVRVATGDVNGDGFEDRIGVAGPGATSQLTVRSGFDNSVLVTPFNVFENSFVGGLYVESADLNNDGFADIIVTPDQSGGPIVAIYDGAKLAAGLTGDAAQLVRFFGIDDPAFRGGARASAGDIDGDGMADLVVAAGFGGGPRVALFNGKTLLNRIGDVNASGGRPDGSFRLMPDFFVFETGLRNGAFATLGDLNGDGMADLVFGGGPGGAPRIRAVSASSLLSQASFTSLDNLPTAGLQLNNFFAGDANTRGGVRLTTRDLDGDQYADLVAASGEGVASSILIYRGANLLANLTPSADQTIDPYASTPLANGVFVG